MKDIVNANVSCESRQESEIFEVSDQPNEVNGDDLTKDKNCCDDANTTLIEQWQNFYIDWRFK